MNGGGQRKIYKKREIEQGENDQGGDGGRRERDPLILAEKEFIVLQDEISSAPRPKPRT
jgi:hypothetical protein